jgi:hypothetical protein
VFPQTNTLSFSPSKKAADRYAAAGDPRTIRAIQKYCKRGDLESQKVETTHGNRYLITPASVDRHIAMIMERSKKNVRDQPRPDETVRLPEGSSLTLVVGSRSPSDTSRAAIGMLARRCNNGKNAKGFCGARQGLTRHRIGNGGRRSAARRRYRAFWIVLDRARRKYLTVPFPAAKTSQSYFVMQS